MMAWDAGHQRRVGPHIEAATGGGPLPDGGLLSVAERPVVHELGAQVRGQPRGHEADPGDEGDVVGDGGRVAGGVEGEGGPGRAVRGVAAHAACLEDGLHRGREPAAGELGCRDLAAQVAGRLRAELDAVGDQLEGQDHLVGGVDEAGDIDGAYVVVAGQHGG